MSYLNRKWYIIKHYSKEFIKDLKVDLTPDGIKCDLIDSDSSISRTKPYLQHFLNELEYLLRNPGDYRLPVDEIFILVMNMILIYKGVFSVVKLPFDSPAARSFVKSSRPRFNIDNFVLYKDPEQEYVSNPFFLDQDYFKPPSPDVEYPDECNLKKYNPINDEARVLEYYIRNPQTNEKIVFRKHLCTGFNQYNIIKTRMMNALPQEMINILNPAIDNRQIIYSMKTLSVLIMNRNIDNRVLYNINDHLYNLGVPERLIPQIKNLDPFLLTCIIALDYYPVKNSIDIIHDISNFGNTISVFDIEVILPVVEIILTYLNDDVFKPLILEFYDDLYNKRNLDKLKPLINVLYNFIYHEIDVSDIHRRKVQKKFKRSVFRKKKAIVEEKMTNDQIYFIIFVISVFMDD